jgi:hypothetical protein
VLSKIKETSRIGRVPRWGLVAVAALLGGCARGVILGPNAVASDGLDVQPATPELRPGEMIVFTAVEGGAAAPVTWSVTEPEGGSIDTEGAYIAPGDLGTYHVVATSTRDAHVHGSATVTVTASPAVVVSVSPQNVSVATGGTLRFSAFVTGADDKSVNWSVQEGDPGGTIDGNGVYTAPAIAGSYHVVAVSVADGTRQGSATVTATGGGTQPGQVAVTVSPKNLNLMVGDNVQFTATVRGASDSAVTWSVQEGSAGGAVTPAGVYTAPAAAGTYHVRASSRADASKSDSATINVSVAAGPGVSISPRQAPLVGQAMLQFQATVTGLADTSVTWSLDEGPAGGSVTATGLYTAPSTAGSYHVVATSNANKALSDRATVTVSGPATGAPGIWQNVTPKGLNLSPSLHGGDNYGVQDVVADPARPGDFYAFACYAGAYKSTDFGLTWTKISAAGSPVEMGKPWGEAIDPNPGRNKNVPPALYATLGTGMYKSTDGGVTWPRSYTPPAGYAADPYNIDIDPNDSQHLLMAFHSDNNLVESKDGGRTWLGRGAVGNATASSYVFFVTSTVWLVVSQWTDSNGTFRSQDSGRTWTKVSTLEHAHGGSQIYVAPNGAVYLPGERGLARSTDTGKTWTVVDGTKQNMVLGTASYIYSEHSFAGQGSSDPLLLRSTDGMTWSKYTTAPAGMTSGGKRGAVAFDGKHYVIVTGNWNAGIWRYVEN